MFSRKVTKARNRGRVREVRGGGGVCADFGFVLHTGLDDPTTAESERSLQKQEQGRMEPSEFCMDRQLEPYKYLLDNNEYIKWDNQLQMIVVTPLVYRTSDAESHLLDITRQSQTGGQSLLRYHLCTLLSFY